MVINESGKGMGFMPWCPKCGTEYREGIAVCADCGSPLVDELPKEDERAVVFTTEQEEIAQRFLRFLEYSDIHTGESRFQKDEGEYAVSVSKEDIVQAKKLFQGFFSTEMETVFEQELDKMETVMEGDLEGVEDKARSSEFFQKKEEKYRDSRSTAITFLILGIAGILFILANALGLISFIQNLFAYALYAAIFAACLFVAIFSFRDAKKAKSQIKAEEELTEAANDWLAKNMTRERLDSSVEKGLAKEVEYLAKMEYMRKELMREFPGLNESYADQLCEEYYNAHME